MTMETATLFKANGKIVRVFFRRKEKRLPKKGEYYLSGAILSIYEASNDLTEEYVIVEPTYLAIPTTGYERGPAFKP